MFQGIYVATPTPFRAGGSLDRDAYRRHVAWLIECGVHGLVPAGTTGEGPTLTEDEREAMFAICKQAAGDRAKVIGGVGTNSTAKSVAAAQRAMELGLDGALAANPYYNKPTEAGQIAHFRAIAEAGPPLMLYNIPGRTAVNLSAAGIAAAAEHPNLVAVKEASGAVGPTAELKILAPRLDVLSGDDALFLPCLAVGGDGVVSVAANVVPREMVALWDAWQAGDAATAREIFLRLWPLFRTLFVETNPIPVKAALCLMGRCEPHLRLPMTDPVTDTFTKLTDVLTSLGIAVRP